MQGRNTQIVLTAKLKTDEYINSHAQMGGQQWLHLKWRGRDVCTVNLCDTVQTTVLLIVEIVRNLPASKIISIFLNS